MSPFYITKRFDNNVLAGKRHEREKIFLSVKEDLTTTGEIGEMFQNPIATNDATASTHY